ncbi:MAG: hypothetical protein IH958_01260 [Chloroflexi bacterium]|nr:hypothetical protein [Chloroflexota bacterium]
MNGRRILLTLRLSAVLAGVLTAGVLLWLQFGQHGSPLAEATDTVDIEVRSFWFCNSSHNGAGYACVTTIAPGTTVRWNFTQGTHTTTECGNNWVNAISCSDPLWNSGSQGSGNTYERTFNSTGEFFYLCKIHPTTMFGKIVVLGSPKPTATDAPPTNTPAPPTQTDTPTPTPGPTDTPTPTPTVKPPDGDTDGDTVPNSTDLDDDGDGCLDTQEHGDDAVLGGQRDPHNFWDFFDPNRDRSVTVLDFFALLQRFASAGDPNIDPLSNPPAPPAYHTRFDRGAVIGANPWNLGPPDGAIAVTDFFSLLVQFGHTCG